jgi:hypothetical protein
VLVSQPAAAQHAQPGFSVGPAVVAPTPGPRHVAPAPAIERFVLRGAGRMEPGRELRFRLDGVPGGQAWLDIPGVTRGIAMRETRPGHYEADYTIRRRDNLEAFGRAVASLKTGNVTTTARVDVRGGGRDEVARDEQPPLISDVFPANGDRVDERGRAHISARVTDEGSGIDPASIRLVVDGRDVSGRVRVDGTEVRYREDLALGRHTAELSVKDRAGNTTRRAWTFRVVDRERHGSLR